MPDDSRTQVLLQSMALQEYGDVIDRVTRAVSSLFSTGNHLRVLTKADAEQLAGDLLVLHSGLGPLLRAAREHVAREGQTVPPQEPRGRGVWPPGHTPTLLDDRPTLRLVGADGLYRDPLGGDPRHENQPCINCHGWLSLQDPGVHVEPLATHGHFYLHSRCALEFVGRLALALSSPGAR